METWASASMADCLVPVSVTGKSKVQSRDYRPAGRFPVIDQGQEQIAGWTDDENAVIDAPLPLVVFGDHTRVFKFQDTPFARGADGTQLLRPKADIDPLFFFYACRAIDLPARGYNRHFTVLKEKELSYPIDASEQKAIAGVLRKTESALQQQDALLGNLQELKRATMRELFTRGLRGEALKEVEIGPVPESWRIQRFDQTVLLQRGFDLPTSKRNAGSVAVFGSNGPVGTHAEAAADVPVPTVMVGRSGSVGKVSFSEEPCWPLNTTLFVADYFGNEPRFVRFWLEYFDLSKFGQGVSVPTLNRNTFGSALVAVPKADEQREIVAILDALDCKIALHRQKRVVLEDLFNSLLHKLMTGEIPVADLDLSALLAARALETAP